MGKRLNCNCSATSEVTKGLSELFKNTEVELKLPSACTLV